MLIDDNEIDNFINQKMLEGTNFAEKIFVYSSGKSALEYFKNIGQDQQMIKNMMPDFIFLDLNMPVIDGFQFLDEFKGINLKSGNMTRICILTTSINPADRVRSEESKFVVDFLNKPLTEEILDSL